MVTTFLFVVGLFVVVWAVNSGSAQKDKWITNNKVEELRKEARKKGLVLNQELYMNGIEQYDSTAQSPYHANYHPSIRV